MFNWSKFLDIAMELSLKNEEEYLRSSLSRYYYSIFNQSRDYLTDILNEYKYSKIDNPHVEVRNRFLNSNDTLEISIGKSLEFLRRLRNDADYDKYKTKTYFKNNLEKAKFKSQKASQSLDVLIRNHQCGWK